MSQAPPPNATTRPGCPDDATLSLYGGRELDAPAAEDIRAHIESCGDCRSVMITLALVEDAGAPTELSVGERFGRYTLSERLGAGSSGVVFAALDHELHRQVALKILHDVAARDSAAAEARLRQEARALATVRHPGIVTIFDVGSFAGRAYLALELIDGLTLAEYVETAPPLSRIIEVFIEAGEALAAAHRRGLVHRDFKPANVMVDARGNVRVMDFGLVRNTADREALPTTFPEASNSVGSTVSGSVVGTPAYMAPEQFAGQPATARSDQYAFCVALYEATFGHRPYPASDVPELVQRIKHEPIEFPTRRPRVPRRLEQALGRGLSRAAQDRFDTMESCLEQLRVAQRQWGPWRILGVAAATGIVLTAAVLGATTVGSGCDDAKSPLEAIWTEGERESVRDAFADTKVGFAEQTWQRVDDELRVRRSNSAKVATEACEIADSDPPRAAAQRECLQQQRVELEVLVERWHTADPRMVATAVDALWGVPPSQTCAEAQLVAGSPNPETRRRALVELGKANVAARLGDPTGARRTARRAERIAGEADAIDLEARAQLVGATASLRLAGAQTAGRELEQAYVTAARIPDDHLMAEIATALVHARGIVGTDPDGALAMVPAAEAAVARAGDDPLQRAGLLQARAGVAYRKSEWARTVELQSAALAIVEPLLGSEHPKVAGQLVNLGAARRALGDFDTAIANHRRAIELTAAAYGEEHPKAARARMALGADFGAAGRLEEALVELRTGSEALANAHGPDHPELAGAYRQVGNALIGLHRLDEAKDYVNRALRIAEAGQQQERFIAALLEIRAKIHRDSGQHAQALATFERALALREPLYGPLDAALTTALNGIADALEELGRPSEAAVFLDRSAKIEASQAARVTP